MIKKIVQRPIFKKKSDYVIISRNYFPRLFLALRIKLERNS